MNASDEFVFLCALRYALGRMSYGPSIVMEAIAWRWSEIGSATRAIMLRDLCEWLGRGPSHLAWLDEWRRWGRQRWQHMTAEEHAETVRQCNGSDRAAVALRDMVAGATRKGPGTRPTREGT